MNVIENAWLVLLHAGNFDTRKEIPAVVFNADSPATICDCAEAMFNSIHTYLEKDSGIVVEIGKIERIPVTEAFRLLSRGQAPRYLIAELSDTPELYEPGSPVYLSYTM